LIYVTDAETAKEAGKHGDTAAGGVEGETVDPKPRKELVLKAVTESGHVLEIRMDQDRPKSFRVEYFPNSLCPGYLDSRICVYCFCN
jgi:hypothetical protein